MCGISLTLFTPFLDILAATIAPPTSQAPNNADLSFGNLMTRCFWTEDREQSSDRRMCEPKALPLRLYACQSYVRCDARYAARAYPKLIPSWLNLSSPMLACNVTTSWSGKQGLNTGRPSLWGFICLSNWHCRRWRDHCLLQQRVACYFEREEKGRFACRLRGVQPFRVVGKRMSIGLLLIFVVFLSATPD